jgi:hypothetical protein
MTVSLVQPCHRVLPDEARTWRTTRRADLICLNVAEEVCGQQTKLLRNGEFDLL